MMEPLSFDSTSQYAFVTKSVPGSQGKDNATVCNRSASHLASILPLPSLLLCNHEMYPPQLCTEGWGLNMDWYVRKYVHKRYSGTSLRMKDTPN